jgi:hypothetical protein
MMMMMFRHKRRMELDGPSGRIIARAVNSSPGPGPGAATEVASGATRLTEGRVGPPAASRGRLVTDSDIDVSRRRSRGNHWQARAARPRLCHAMMARRCLFRTVTLPQCIRLGEPESQEIMITDQ